jgi:hypothetical protein
MKEWAVLSNAHSDADWLALAREAKQFVEAPAAKRRG